MSLQQLLFNQLDRLRLWLMEIPLPGWLGALETRRQVVLAFVILSIPPLAISTVIDMQRDMISISPEPLGTLAIHMSLVSISGVMEEVLFRGYAKKFLGNGGLLIGTFIWVILHQFYAAVPTVYRLPGDVFHGIFYMKLWRGRLWWLALFIHPLWNCAVAGGWQLARLINS